MTSSVLKFCAFCVMDGSARELVLDASGVCNFCHAAQEALENMRAEKHMLISRLSRVMVDGMGKEYDCLVGLSGGVDSSTLLMRAVDHGLRVLAFSVDNGWNNPKADENIMRLVEGLKVPFIRVPLDKAAFRSVQAAFIRAGVPNIEIPTDHALMAVTYQMAREYKIKWVLSGANSVGESIMPASWGYNAWDLTHIKSVYGGKLPIAFPRISLFKWNWYKWARGVKFLYLLDYQDYNVEAAKQELQERFGWQDYGMKHEENYFTAWFQNYYLFQKWGIDKRKAHLSSLINAGQMTRAEAVEILGRAPEYPALGIEHRVNQYPRRSHDEYKKGEWKYKLIAKGIKLARLQRL